jgi:hypothetical protein
VQVLSTLERRPAGFAEPHAALDDALTRLRRERLSWFHPVAAAEGGVRRSGTISNGVGVDGDRLGKKRLTGDANALLVEKLARGRAAAFGDAPCRQDVQSLTELDSEFLRLHDGTREVSRRR